MVHCQAVILAQGDQPAVHGLHVMQPRLGGPQRPQHAGVLRVHLRRAAGATRGGGVDGEITLELDTIAHGDPKQPVRSGFTNNSRLSGRDLLRNVQVSLCFLKMTKEDLTSHILHYGAWVN